MSAPLNDIWWKIKRADEHIAHLGRLHLAFQKAKADAVVRQDDADDPERDQWIITDASFDQTIRLVLGDAVHNMRTTLDYLIDVLVRANRGTPTTRTAFPIWRQGGRPSRQQYESLVQGKVNGAHSSVHKACRRLQPYEGGGHHLLWAVDQLDILDKHRLLLVVGTRSASPGVHIPLRPTLQRMFRQLGTEHPDPPDWWLSLTDKERVPLKDGDVLYAAPKTAHTEPDDQPKFTFEIAFAEPKALEGDPILPSLAQMRGAVMETIEAFEGFASGGRRHDDTP